MLMHAFSKFFALLATSAALATTESGSHATTTPRNRTVSVELFAELDELSRLVAASYCVGYQGIQKPFECLNHCNEFPDLELVQTFDTGLITNSCGYIALSHAPAYPPRILVIFRGTNSFANFISDLQTAHAEYVPYATTSGRECANCTVHSGFMYSWNATRDMIFPQLKVLRNQYPTYPIVLAGHSLGGAVAGIAGLELKSDDKFWGDTKVVTFGEPMFGNAGMAKFVDATFGCNGTTAADSKCSYQRVTHAGDPVPLMPPKEWGWRQHGSEIFITKDDLPPERDDLILCSGPDDPACLSGGDQAVSKDAVNELSDAQQPLLPEDQDRRKLVARGLFEVPPRWRVWQLLFAHREYIWRLGLCFDPDWPWESKPDGTELETKDDDAMGHEL